MAVCPRCGQQLVSGRCINCQPLRPGFDRTTFLIGQVWKLVMLIVFIAILLFFIWHC